MDTNGETTLAWVPDRPAPQPPAARFDEQLSVPWWWWPLSLGVAGLLAAEVHLGYPGVRAWLPYLLTAPVAVAVLLRLGRHRVQLNSDELLVGDAHIPLHHLGEVVAVPARYKRRALGPELDPAAFVLHRPWIGSLLRVELTDPRDPTPYWLFSVRRADTLAALLRQQPSRRPPQGDPQTRNGRPPSR